MQFGILQRGLDRSWSTMGSPVGLGHPSSFGQLACDFGFSCGSWPSFTADFGATLLFDGDGKEGAFPVSQVKMPG